jgi:Ca-activated chloride channel family protein
MTPLQLDFVPQFDALPRGKAASLDVLLRLHAPELTEARPLPPLNLAIVLDRSGSMEGEKLAYAKAAAKQAVALLGERDRLSVVSFADEVETVATGAGPSDHDVLMRAIEQLSADGSTALHGGWARGVSLLQGGPREVGAVSRVLLVSDGQANRGERRPEVIAHQARRESAEGVATSTLGVGRDFNEDLLEAMARAGDGEYHFVETPAQLPAIFEAELRSMTRTLGRRCSLSLLSGPGVRIADVLNDLERNPSGSLRLPNLVHGRTLEVLVRLDVSASDADARHLLEVRVAWDAVETGGRQHAEAAFGVPVVVAAAFDALSPAPSVVEQALLLEAARVKQLAVAALDAGQWDRARKLLEGALRQVGQGPTSAELEHEKEKLSLLLTDLDSQDATITRKRSKAQSYDRQNSRRRPGSGGGGRDLGRLQRVARPARDPARPSRPRHQRREAGGAAPPRGPRHRGLLERLGRARSAGHRAAAPGLAG